VIRFRPLFSAAALTFLLLWLAPAPLVADDTAELPNVVANDNRTAAGQLKGRQLTLRLELRKARWFPDAEIDPHIDLHAFGETGKAPQIPGPLIRVNVGTEIVVSVTNLLKTDVRIHGLHERPGQLTDTFEVAAGATREVRFKAGAAGTYTYWASTANAPIIKRLTEDTQLSGAFIVDPPGKVADDRVFVLGLWLPDPAVFGKNVSSINGKSWPYTERLSMRAGETASWRVINGSAEAHSMHMHGFYFRVNSLGNGENDEAYSGEKRPMVVTQMISPGGTMAMTWVPEREGNWLFHCHMMIHMSRRITVPEGKPLTAHAEHDSTSLGMSGLVLGIRVTGNVAKPAAAKNADVRHLKLTLSQRQAGLSQFGMDLEEAGQARRKDDAVPALIGPRIVLTRGQPAEVEVVNTLKDATTIHWHGIELENLYDGVAGYTGDSNQMTPAITPGGSFVAKMTPSRAGTFIYHTHWHDEDQLLNGIYGPLIVLEPGEKYDPDHDKIFLISFGKLSDPLGQTMLINGTPQPSQQKLRVGEKYRFRLINITANAVDMEVSLSDQGRAVQWKQLAKDGADLPEDQRLSADAKIVLTVGETRDFEYQSSSPGELQLTAYLPRSRRRVVLALAFEGEAAK